MPRIPFLARLTALSLGVAGLAALGTSAATAVLPSQCVTTGDTVVCTYTAPTAPASFTLTVPNAVTDVQVHAVGRRGADSNGATGGSPAYVDTTVPAAGGDTFSIAFKNDGGTATAGGGAGGGSTQVSVGGTRLLVAAGGGGAGGVVGAGAALSNGADAGLTATNAAPNTSGAHEVRPAQGGKAATPTAGGPGGGGAQEIAGTCVGAQGNGFNASAGNANKGGNGGAATQPGQVGGGGGGGGLFGGGGGGSGGYGTCGLTNSAGGGGGSDLVPDGGSDGIATSESAVVTLTFTTFASASYSASTLDFGSVEVGKSSGEQTVTVTNDGSQDLAFGAATVSSQFTKGADGCSGTTLLIGASCSIAVRFTPTVTGVASGALTIDDGTASSPKQIGLTGIAVAPADLKILNVGSVYAGRDHLVTRTVKAAGATATYKLGILNESSTPQTYRLALTPGSPAQVWTTGFRAAELPKDAGGDYVTPSVAAHKVLALTLKVTPAQVVEPADVTLLSADGGRIESVSTETNLPAGAGTTRYELFAKQGTDPYIGGPVATPQTATGPALNLNQTATYTLRLENDGTDASTVGLKVTDLDGCAGSFKPTVKVGTKDITAAALAGSYRTPSLAPSKYTTVKVSVKRIAAGCPSMRLMVQSLGGLGSPIRTSYLLTNAGYDAATD
ncbi:choice-of-anchor D domain-containing protein [Nocardioides panacisoli]|uniref:HYDIN/VesB/CFA65-like Ig-like domain-containing protein n=1 Tax=Nocardioides panacisoli TaxID=627624 RepID=A0ABP7I2U3_9ACTN